MDRAAETVRAWRPDGLPRVIAMDGVVSSHAAEPRGEYMIGVIERRPVAIVRGQQRHFVLPGGLAVLDPCLPHRGVPAADGAWRCRLLIMELPDVAALAGDPGLGREAAPLFPDPLLPDPGLAGRFTALHQLLAGSASRLERQAALAAWWDDAARWSPNGPADDRPRRPGIAALRRALSMIADSPVSDISLADLAAEAGLSEYRLMKAFRERFGMPHAFQVAQRVNRARRLLEAGEPAAGAAVKAGFFDQSHLHRHFRRRMGITPAAYAAFFRGFVQEPRAADP